MGEQRITDEQANAYATQSTWPAGQELTITKALMWLGADLLDARHEIERLENDENEDMAQEREYRRLVEIDNAEYRRVLEEGVKLLRKTWSSSSDFAHYAQMWVLGAEAVLNA